MAKLILLNKPFQVLSQFSPSEGKETLAKFINIPGVYPAGRLDYDSEGLLLLTDNGHLQHRISDPKHKSYKTYWVQVEGIPDTETIEQLCCGVQLKDGMTLPSKTKIIAEPNLWPRNPPIRQRANDATTWLEIQIYEGRNRQVRRMTAAVGHPTLRLVRMAIGDWHLGELLPGEFKQLSVHMPKARGTKYPKKSQSAKMRKNVPNKGR
ncbi:pseudouridine synthase [Bermanella sp. R86510]|uniref:pseudouridine synthase n=1 Tax=unclassified Bermanella TaxID=2627862 RepID=UPI0037C5260D